ncbi:Predicted N-acyltransferase, GNAT family [Haladaptatus litoreus]|uniref:Predicted N-acyltransferase, GNAT family n=1 Tax=Haladaptatus litoreus TaxID=553468 RepID=A0A1N6V9A5_9EURY|nr:GNAT family N-acetyltransferase [Haladaptatus litoreus]SIQ74348.1 Predicted N-acyltransferase, GNAT family [Haladaptatus litoreus]
MNQNISIVRTDSHGHETELRNLLREYFTRANERGQEWFDDDDFGANVEEIVAGDLDRLESATIVEPLFLALLDDEIAGSVQIKQLDETTAEVKRLYVKPAYRGEGLGRKLMETIRREADADGYETLRLGVSPFHEKAQSLYADFGFEYKEPYDETQAPPTIRENWNFMKLSLSD